VRHASTPRCAWRQHSDRRVCPPDRAPMPALVAASARRTGPCHTRAARRTHTHGHVRRVALSCQWASASASAPRAAGLRHGHCHGQHVHLHSTHATTTTAATTTAAATLLLLPPPPPPSPPPPLPLLPLQSSSTGWPVPAVPPHGHVPDQDVPPGAVLRGACRVRTGPEAGSPAQGPQRRGVEALAQGPRRRCTHRGASPATSSGRSPEPVGGCHKVEHAPQVVRGPHRVSAGVCMSIVVSLCGADRPWTAHAWFAWPGSRRHARWGVPSTRTRSGGGFIPTGKCGCAAGSLPWPQPRLQPHVLTPPALPHLHVAAAATTHCGRPGRVAAAPQ